MSFDFSESEIATGRTCPLVLDQLKGDPPPIIHVEHLGDTNKTYLSEQLGSANASAKKKAERAKERGDAIITEKDVDRQYKEMRADLKHAVRDLDAVFNVGDRKGQKAAKTDIPLFVSKLPNDVVKFIWLFARNPNNFREYVLNDSEETKILVEKSSPA